MNIFQNLLLVVSFLQFSKAIKVVRVFCFEDETKNTTEWITDANGGNIGVAVKERFHIVLEDDQVQGNVITIKDYTEWPKIVGDTIGNLRLVPEFILKSLCDNLWPKLQQSLTDKGIADAAIIIYEEGDEGFPDSFRCYDVAVLECTSQKVVKWGVKTEYTVKLEIKNPVSSPAKLTMSLVHDPSQNGIHEDEADGVKANFGKEVDGLPVTLVDMNGDIIVRNYNRKMYFATIPPLKTTQNQILNKLHKIPGSGLLKVDKKFSEPLVFRIAAGGKGEVNGQVGDSPLLMMKHVFSAGNQAGFMVNGACAA